MTTIGFILLFILTFFAGALTGILFYALLLANSIHSESNERIVCEECELYKKYDEK